MTLSGIERHFGTMLAQFTPWQVTPTRTAFSIVAVLVVVVVVVVADVATVGLTASVDVAASVRRRSEIKWVPREAMTGVIGF